LWLPALAFGLVGVLGLADFQKAEIGGKLWLIAPHLGGVVITALGGYRHPWAGVVGLAGSALMAGLSWWDKLTRRTEGFEWQFNNALGGAMCLEANFFVLAVVLCAVSLIAALAEHTDEGMACGGDEPGVDE
jgi:hypothetical protein